MESFQRIVLYERKHIGRFSILYQCIFNQYFPLMRTGELTSSRYIASTVVARIEGYSF